jgi:hypothetical protein
LVVSALAASVFPVLVIILQKKLATRTIPSDPSSLISITSAPAAERTVRFCSVTPLPVPARCTTALR